MLAVSHAGRVAYPADSARALPRNACCAQRNATYPPERVLARGETLFRADEARNRIYRVEYGALCHYMQWNDGHHEIVEFAFPGDIIGFGHLERHVSTAQATIETAVREVSERELDALSEIDGSLSARIAAAADREFDFLRERAVNSFDTNAVDKAAALLMVLSQVNSAEGRDPTLIADEFTTGAVAQQLETSIDDLSHALQVLEHRGLVKATARGLQITDVAGLEALADGA